MIPKNLLRLISYCSVFLLLIPCVVITACDASPRTSQVWPNIRDGVFYIRHQVSHPNEPKVDLRWNDAWIANSQEERIYWQSPTGRLIQRLTIPHSKISGTHTFNVIETLGDYRLEIPGASFRNYTLSVDRDTAIVFEPVKVHKSVSIASGTQLFFKVPANTAFSLNGKYYKGVSSLSIADSENSKNKYRLALKKSQRGLYSDFQSLAIPAQDQEITWTLIFGGSGKVSFWLDGVNNLFAQRAEHLFIPKLAPGQVSVSVSNPIKGGQSTKGQTPLLGAALPFSIPPESTYPLIDQLHLKASNLYFFEDVLIKKRGFDSRFLELYEQRFNIKQGVSIRAKTGRIATINNAVKTRHFLMQYLESRHKEGLLTDYYIAIADEPNLNYSSYSEFENDYLTIVGAIKASRNPLIAKTLFAAPQASRFLNGPTRQGADHRSGYQWAEQLLQHHPDLVDALSWHEWLVRDLIATEWFYDSIIEARKLSQKYPKSDGVARPLIISQTNISSGQSLSPYEQDTFFAALWWTSVICQSIRSGDLAQLVWFKAADDGTYNKGLVTKKRGQFQLKPVGLAMSFLSESMLDKSVSITNPSVEVDIAISTKNRSSEGEKDQISIIGVNKSKRKQTLTLTLPESLRFSGGIAQKLNKDLTIEDLKFQQTSGGTVKIELEGEDIFTINATL
ncbi:MAG: hypothetical protein KUG82_17950 [Pseudomonadales bacterium]|nr:hypothetical protein [Pseudomonadales bacterium]